MRIFIFLALTEAAIFCAKLPVFKSSMSLSKVSSIKINLLSELKCVHELEPITPFAISSDGGGTGEISYACADFLHCGDEKISIQNDNMSFKKTTLWKAAFENARPDAVSSEQARLANCYESMRIRASALVSKIAGDLPHMTVHDVTHLDALWEMASIAAGESFDLNPAEAFVFGGAILFHDAALTLAAYPRGIAELREQTEWRDLHSRYIASIPADDAAMAKDAENRATEDALRLLHAKKAESVDCH